jgi:hypothetical protein
MRSLLSFLSGNIYINSRWHKVGIDPSDFLGHVADPDPLVEDKVFALDHIVFCRRCGKSRGRHADRRSIDTKIQFRRRPGLRFIRGVFLSLPKLGPVGFARWFGRHVHAGTAPPWRKGRRFRQMRLFVLFFNKVIDGAIGHVSAIDTDAMERGRCCGRSSGRSVVASSTLLLANYRG